MKLPKFGKIGRYTVCILLLAAIFLRYEIRLFEWQVIKGDEFEEQALSDRTDAIELDGVRGQILDTNGEVLAGNRISYNIVFNRLNEVYSERNATIIKVIDLMEERGEEWRDRLPIVIDSDGDYQFSEDSDSEIESMRELLNLADYTTADECMAELASEFGCEGYSREDARNVASVRYSMVRDGYSRTTPYVFAEDVSLELVGIISQRADDWKGVEPKESVARYYGEDGSLTAHIIGHVGSRSEEEYQQSKKDGTAYDYETNLSGYKWADVTGRGGFEEAFETELRGKRGLETIYVDDAGEVTSTAVTVQPEEGNTVYTTIDSDLQRVANLSLKKNIEGNTTAKNCTSGAVVVLDVSDFGVLVNSSYPTYDMNLYTTDNKYINEKQNDKGLPLLNRALGGIYVPGSVFKPLVALTALQERVISAGTTYVCPGYFEYEDMTLKCLCGGGTHNVYSAIADSCNTFFCNVGLDTRIQRIDAYAEFFGLGEKTGVELSEEVGIMANPQEHYESTGEQWLDGLTAQTAIGQSDNMFTPMQLAAYCATIANGGVRLQTHFLDKITDYSGEEILQEYEPVELYDAGLTSDVLNAVKAGMIGTATYGTASTVFADYPVSVACKTGTAETSDSENGTEANLSFICYAPADNPEIAVAVMLEYGNKGRYAQNVAKDILDQYFGYYTWDEDGNRYNQGGDLVDDDGKVLKTKAELDEEKAKQEEKDRQEFLNSAIENGENTLTSGTAPDNDVSQGDSPTAGRGEDIPMSPFTGQEPFVPTESAAPLESSPEAGGKKEYDSPYYTASE